jgi:cytochrome c oxidase subunit 2
MKVDLYERIWMWMGGALIVLFLAVMIGLSTAHAIHPPSHVETIDPATVWDDPRFAEPGVQATGSGVTVTMVSQMFAFLPPEVTIPPGVPVTFRVTSTDVIHGFQIAGTNGNATVVPGYVSQFTLTFATAGEYLIVCNEYCGLGHHGMYGKVIVEEPAS